MIRDLGVRVPGFRERRHPDRGVGTRTTRLGAAAPTVWGVGEQIDKAIERALEPDERALAKIRGQNKLTARERIDAAARSAVVRRGRPARQQPGRRERRDDCPPMASSPVAARSTGCPCVVVANDPMVKAGSWGARTVEKMVRAVGGGARRAGADLLAGRLGRRPAHRPGPAVPRAARRRADLLQPGAPVGPGARRSAACSGRRRPAARTSRRSAMSCSWSRATPRCTSARRGWRRWSSARSRRWRRWAAPACTSPSRAAPTTSPTTTPTPSTRPAPTSRTSRGRGVTTHRCTRASRRP